LFRKAIQESHSEPARKVVVTKPRLAQRYIMTNLTRRRAGPVGKVFEQLCDLAGRQAKEAVSPLLSSWKAEYASESSRRSRSQQSAIHD
jgi:hypothetical protein